MIEAPDCESVRRNDRSDKFVGSRREAGAGEWAAAVIRHDPARPYGHPGRASAARLVMGGLALLGLAAGSAPRAPLAVIGAASLAAAWTGLATK